MIRSLSVKLSGFLLLATLLFSCTVKVPDYAESDTGESSPWVDVYGDTTKDMSVYINYANGTVTATIGGYSHPDSMGFIEDINVSINAFSEQNVPLMVIYGKFPGTDNLYLEANSYAEIADRIVAGCDSLAGDQIDYQISRTYSIAESELPESLELSYEVKTEKGNRSGKIVFSKIEREVEQSMRFH